MKVDEADILYWTGKDVDEASETSADDTEGDAPSDAEDEDSIDADFEEPTGEDMAEFATHCDRLAEIDLEATWDEIHAFAVEVSGADDISEEDF